MTNQSQPPTPDNQAAAGERLEEIRQRWPVGTKDDIDYLFQRIAELESLLQQPATSERCEETGGFTCECCGRNCEVRIDRRFCKECAGYRAANGAEQAWCDHCSADLNGVKHILCERCYREYAGPKWFDAATPFPCPKCGHSTWRQNKSLLTWFNCDTCLYRENVLTEEVGGTVEDAQDDGDCAIGCGCPDDPWREPSTATTSEAAREAAEAVVDEIDLRGPSPFSLREQKVDHFAAIISKYLPDAGEVERLTAKVADLTGWRTIAKENSELFRVKCDEADQLRAELSTARANAIRPRRSS
jgi:hypothetical protein